MAEAKFVRMSPENARALLRRNTHNRDVNGLRVEQYAADMAAGNWHLNGEAVKIGSNGAILDGQHRLLAIVEAGQTIELLIVTGLDPKTQETMDQGLPRSFGDVLQLRGESNYYVLAAATRVVAVYERDGSPAQSGPAPSILEMSRVLERNPGLRDSANLLSRLRSGRAWIRISPLAALHFLFSAVDEESANDFMTRLATGEHLDPHVPPSCAIYLLRERLIANHIGDEETRLSHRAMMAFVVKSWNAYYESRPIARLFWATGKGERFPAISGLVDLEDAEDPDALAVDAA